MQGQLSHIRQYLMEGRKISLMGGDGTAYCEFFKKQQHQMAHNQIAPSSSPSPFT